MVFLYFYQGCDPFAQTQRSKLQHRRARINQQINKEMRMRAGAENLFRWGGGAAGWRCLEQEGQTRRIQLSSCSTTLMSLIFTVVKRERVISWVRWRLCSSFFCCSVLVSFCQRADMVAIVMGKVREGQGSLSSTRSSNMIAPDVWIHSYIHTSLSLVSLFSATLTTLEAQTEEACCCSHSTAVKNRVGGRTSKCSLSEH